jgi:response regulator RpfG family c-di-GMP phosphodiesterase
VNVKFSVNVGNVFFYGEAVQIIQDDKGTQFDPVLTEVFVAVVGR